MPTTFDIRYERHASGTEPSSLAVSYAVTPGASGPRHPTSARVTSYAVTFPCGYTFDADGDGINLYYGAADTCVVLARGSITQIPRWLDRHGAV